MNIDPIHPEFGARISGVDLSQPLDDARFAQIDEAINRYSILLFEDQHMNDAAHLEFTRRFGQLEEEHVSYYSRGEVTYIGRVGNIDDDGNKVSARQIKASTGNEMWHSDSSFREIPAMYSMLCAYEVPDVAGETEFASARAAYQRLDQTTQRQIEDMVGIHDYIFSRTKVGEDAVTENQRTYMHPVRQRLVRQNPVTGERNIFVGSHVKEIEGIPPEQARPLIKRLIAEVTRPESVYRHRWRVGDFMIWDNRCILHRGCGYDADKYRRRMHQTRVRGCCPSIAESVN
ncbi:MAG: TauD/TfdA family dioxygenase [Gammaproteobacteria bacterium]|nr:TauD/TfdA family dioxygenase [Gammaproteobacteria bacterium]